MGKSILSGFGFFVFFSLFVTAFPSFMLTFGSYLLKHFFVVENFNWPDIDRFDCKCIFNLTVWWIRRQECRQVFCLLCIGTFNISLGLHPISYVIYLHFWHKSLKKSAFCTHPPGTTVIWEVHTSAFMLWKMTPWLKHFCSEKKWQFKLPSMEKSDKSWLIKILGSQTFSLMALYYFHRQYIFFHLQQRND